jgi:hypothetical protein
LENRKVLSGDWYKCKEEDTREECKRVNVVEIRPVETIPGMGGGR